MSWLSSALTAPGTSAAETNRDRQSTVQRGARDAFNQINPTLQSQAGFANQLEPMRQRSVWDTINASNPWGVQTSLANSRRGLMDSATANLPAMYQALSQGGAGIGALQGAGYAALNNANSQGNDMLAYWYSPEGRATLAKLAQSSIMQGQSIPALDQIGGLANIIYGRPAPQVGASPLAQIAGLGSQLYSMGAFGGK